MNRPATRRPLPLALTASDPSIAAMSVAPNISSAHTEDSHSIASSDSSAPVRLSAINPSGPHETWYQVSIRLGARSSCRPTSNASRLLRCRSVGHRAEREHRGVRGQASVARQCWGALSPPAQCLEDRLEVEAPLRQPVDGHKGRWRQRDVVHHSGLLQLAQPHCQRGRRWPRARQARSSLKRLGPSINSLITITDQRSPTTSRAWAAAHASPWSA